MTWQDRLIASCTCWSDFWDRTNKLSTDGKKGAAFERLTQLYLQTTPEYRSELQHVWLLREIPPDICRRINLPSVDEGVDLIARTRRGEYWAIQAKLYSPDEPLTRRKLGTFASLAFNTCNNIALAVVAHTSAKPISKRHLMRNTVEIGLDRWQSADWSLIVRNLKGKSARPPPRKPSISYSTGPSGWPSQASDPLPRTRPRLSQYSRRRYGSGERRAAAGQGQRRAGGFGSAED